MSELPNAQTGGPHFEFEALSRATNYRAALLREFSPFLRGRVLEVGAGAGQFTTEMSRLAAIQELVVVEPNPHLCERIRQLRLPRDLVEGTVGTLAADFECDAIVSVNVLEHIADDEAELAAYRTLLGRASGCLCLFVPARPEIYAPIDRDFGHYRRYTRPELSRKLRAAGFTILRLHYFNSVGYLAWWFSFGVLKKRRFSPGAVAFFDRFILPFMHRLECTVLRPAFGQSLVAVATAL